MFGDRTIEQVRILLEEDLKSELREQGHHLTGALEDSIQSIREALSSGVALEMFAEGYIDPVNSGVPSSNIPFDSSTSSGAKTSQYIQGLKNYAMLRMGITNEKEALSVAFAIAKTHEKEGMPTGASAAHSRNGRRTLAIESTMKENQREYEQRIDEIMGVEIDDALDQDFQVKII